VWFKKEDKNLKIKREKRKQTDLLKKIGSAG